MKKFVACLSLFLFLGMSPVLADLAPIEPAATGDVSILIPVIAVAAAVLLAVILLVVLRKKHR